MGLLRGVGYDVARPDGIVKTLHALEARCSLRSVLAI